MLRTTFLFTVVSLIGFIKGAMEPFIVDGKKAKIHKFPHSAFLNIFCVDELHEDSLHWICGSSIINDRIVLTAGHCLSGCGASSVITISVGHSHNKKGIVSTMLYYLLHENYDSIKATNDIALVKLKTPIELNKNVKRIALMRSPPYAEKAQIAGWGVINEETNASGNKLLYINQYVWTQAACKSVMKSVPKGVICANNGNNSYSSRGDSGSALVVRGYIQIGIVSYKMPTVSKNLVVYTDTGYFFDWISKNARRLYCI